MAALTATQDTLQAFRKYIEFKLRSAKDHIPTLTRSINLDAPREVAALYQERSALVAQAQELQAVLDYLHDFESEQAYDARTCAMLGG